LLAFDNRSRAVRFHRASGTSKQANGVEANDGYVELHGARIVHAIAANTAVAGCNTAGEAPVKEVKVSPRASAAIDAQTQHPRGRGQGLAHFYCAKLLPIQRAHGGKRHEAFLAFDNRSCDVRFHRASGTGEQQADGL